MRQLGNRMVHYCLLLYSFVRKVVSYFTQFSLRLNILYKQILAAVIRTYSSAETHTGRRSLSSMFSTWIMTVLFRARTEPTRTKRQTLKFCVKLHWYLYIMLKSALTVYYMHFYPLESRQGKQSSRLCAGVKQLINSFHNINGHKSDKTF